MKVYDYIIIGAGAAGLHMALAMCRDSFFHDRSILILEKSAKTVNDRTWCFWEEGQGLWDDITTKKWSKGKFVSESKEIDLNVGSYQYKMVRGIDFYNYAKQTIGHYNNIDWIKAEVKSVIQESVNKVEIEEQSYEGNHIFDSRIDNSFYQKNDEYIRLLQHFKGYIIESERPVFDDSSFTMMDYRIQHVGSTNFTYVLPLSNTTALVEFTYFSPNLVEEHVYDQHINEYIDSILKIEKYKVIDTEYGVIPMSNYPFHHLNTNQLTKIGTAGSWVKPSTGYSFKNAEKYSKKVLDNIKKGKKTSAGLIKTKFRKYDSIFLDVLLAKNDEGAKLFDQMYKKNKAKNIFKFLDEETFFLEELKIMSSFDLAPFAKASFNHLF